ADQGARLRSGLPDGAEQAQFAGALTDGQGKGVGDAHEGYDDRENEHHVDQAEDGVDPLGHAAYVLGAVLDLGLAVCGGERRDGFCGGGGAGGGGGVGVVLGRGVVGGGGAAEVCWVIR